MLVVNVGRGLEGVGCRACVLWALGFFLARLDFFLKKKNKKKRRRVEKGRKKMINMGSVDRERKGLKGGWVNTTWVNVRW